MLGDQKRITTINNLKTIQILEIYKYIWYLRDIKSYFKKISFKIRLKSRNTFDAAEANRKSVP